MTFDLVSLLIVSVIVCTACGIFYALDSARTLAGRHMAAWLSGFASTLLSAVCYLAATYTHDAVWIVSIANASMVASLAALWVGCRLFNGRSGLVPVGTVLVGASVLATLLDTRSEPEWAGSVGKFVLLALLSALIARETRRGRLRSAPPAAILALALAVYACYSVARLAIFLTTGYDSAVFTLLFSTEIATNMNLVFVVVVAVGLVRLRSWERRERLAPDRREIVAVGRRQFPAAATRARELLPSGRRFAVMEIGIDGFADVRRAYGLASAGELEALLTEIVYASLPPQSVCARVRNGVVIVATSTADGPDAEFELAALARPIATGYRVAVGGHLSGFAGTTRLGIAVDDVVALPLEVLRREAAAARDVAETRGEAVRLVHPTAERPQPDVAAEER